MSKGFNSMDDPGAYLEHFGVKGQKWGVRNWQNEDGSLTPAGREHYGYGLVVDGSRVNYNAGNSGKTSDYAVANKAYKNGTTQSTRDLSYVKYIPAGTKLYRSNTSTDSDLDSDHIYVTQYDIDRDMYAGYASNLLETYRGEKNVDHYEHEYEVESELKIAPIQEVESAIYSVMATKMNQTINELSYSRVDKEFVDNSGYYTYEDCKQFRELSNEPISNIGQYDDYNWETLDDLSYYNALLGEAALGYGEMYNDKDIASLTKMFEYSLGTSEINMNEVRTRLKEKGYNGMYDTASINYDTSSISYENQNFTVSDDKHRGKWIEGYAPMVIFDTDSLAEVSASKLTKDDIRDADKRYRTWQNKVRDTDDLFYNIKAALAGPESESEIAERLGISQSYVSAVKNGNV